MATYPPVVIVDENDQVVGRSPLTEVWEQGLRHRIAMVIVEDSDARVLLHRRAATMKIYPGRWDTVGGHVDVDPDYEITAELELEEEAGVKDVVLQEVAHLYSEEPYDNGVIAKRFIKIFRTGYSGEPKVHDTDEATISRWFTRGELRALAQDHPEQIAECLHRCLPYILGS